MTEEVLNRFSVDNNGNLYFDNYWLYINKDDNIDFFKVNNKQLISKVSTEITNKEEILQIKMIESEIEELRNKFNDVDNAYDFTEHDVLHFKKYIYNPELKFVKEKHQAKEEEIKYQLNHDDINMDDENEDEDNNNYEPYFTINGDFNLNNNNFDDISNYEVYLINNNNLVSYTEMIYDSPIYRISILNNNNKIELQLNIIGTKTITYDIEKIDNNDKPFNLKVKGVQYQMI